MRHQTSSSFGEISLKSRQTDTRSATPNEILNSSAQKLYTPYPLYKQKIRALLRPPDYQSNPPKFMSVREPRSEFEKKEASTQVKLLKKTFNTMYQRFNSYDRTLAVLKSEAIRVNALKAVGENDLEHLKKRIEELEKEENNMLAKIRDEHNNNAMYKHMRERFRQTLMHLEVKNQYLQDQIRLRDFLLESMHRKKIKTLENKFTKVTAFKQLQKTVVLDIKDRTQDINLLKEDIEAREKIHELRKTRLKKYEEIAETAANEERDLRNNNMREAVLVSVLWAKFLEYKLTYEKNRYASIENAFQQIKGATLLDDINEILTRFLTKEERFVELMGTLNKNKDKCLVFLRKNDETESKIDELLLTQKSTVDANIIKLKEHVCQTIGKISLAKDRLKKAKVAREQVKEWVLKRLNMVLDNGKIKNTKLNALFEMLHNAIKQKIRNFQKSPFITEL